MRNPSIEPLESRIAPAVLSFAGPVEITEGQNGQSDMVFKVLLDSPSPLPLTVKVSTLDGTATVADGDYTRITDQIIEFPANTVEKTFVVKINGDTNFEPDETFSVVLSSPSAGHTIGAPSTATGTILKGTDTPPTLTVSPASIVEKNSGAQQLKFTVSLSNKSAEAITFEWGTQDLAPGDGKAVAGSDYTAVPAGTMVTINPGSTTAEIVVDILPDRIVEPNETFEVQLANPKLAVSLTELSFATGTTGKAVGTIVNDEPTVSLGITTSPTPNEGTTGDTTVNFRVNLSVAASEDIVLKLSTIAAASGIQATPGEDFIALVNKEFIIQAGQTFVNVPVTLKGDAIHEGNELFALSIVEANMGGELLTPSVASREITIVNDDALPTLTVRSATLVEPASGNSVMNFTVSLSHAADKPITFDWNTALGTATALDFTGVPITSVTIPAGQKSVVLPVTILSDSLSAEGNESFRVVIANGMLDGQSLATTVGGSEATGTIREAALSVSLVGPVLGTTEGTSGTDPDAVFTIKRGDTDSAAEPIIVRVSTVDGTATSAGNDYRSLNSVAFTIPAGLREIVVPVGINPDNIDESNEAFSLRIDKVEIGGADFQGFSTALANATILDDDDAPKLSISDVSATEGHSGTKTVAFVVSLSNVSTENITFEYITEFTTGANAADGADFVVVSVPVQVTIPAGESSKSVELTFNGDIDREEAETFNVKISNPRSGGVPMAADAISDNVGLVTILPDEPTVTVTGPAAGLAEGSTTGGKTNHTFTIRLDRISATPTAVRVSTVDGTALAGEDFEGLSGKWVLIPAGSASATFSVAALHDQKLEAAESFTVQVDEVRVGVGTALDSNEAPTGGLVQPHPSAITPATGTINNDDLATLSIGDATLVEGGAGVSQMAFIVTLSKPASQDVTFKYSTTNGSAFANEDFEPVAGAVGVIPAGSTTVTVFINVNGDASDERDEVFTVNLSEAKFGTNTEVVTFADGVGQGTILNDETTVSIEELKTVSENTPGAVALVVSLSKVAVHPVQVTLSLTNGSAIKGADFTDPSALIVTIPVGSDQVTVSVPILNDTVFETNETNETFDVYLVGATNAQLGATTKGTVTIESEDLIPELTITGETKAEGTKSSLNDTDFTTFTFTANLNRASGSPVTFDWKTLALFGGNNATAGDDFVAVPTTLVTIPVGVTSATFTVQVSKEVFNEAINEADELLTVEVSNVSGALLKDPDVTGGPVKTLASTIRNDEATRTIAFNDVRFVEGASGVSMMEFVVALSGRADRDVTFNWQTSSGGSNPATAGDDYVSVAVTSATIPAGATEVRLSVPVNGDTNLEQDETFVVSISDVRIGGIVMTVADVDSVGTIRNDEIVASIAPIDATKLVVEGDDVVSTVDEEFVEVRIPITLSQAVPAGQSVTVGWKFVTAGSTATIDVDYKADNFVVAFAAGETTKDIVVKIRPDLLSEINETFSVELVDATTVNAVVSAVDKLSVVTIQDNETAPVISIADVGALEIDGTITFTIKLDRVASTEISVTIETRDDSAVSSGLQADFTAKAQEIIRFAPGVTSIPYTVAISNDLDNTELIESFFVKLSNAVTGTLPGGAATFEAKGTIASPNYSTISVSDLSVVEGNGTGSPTKLEFVVSRAGSTEKAVTGNYAIAFDALLSAGFTAADAVDLVSDAGGVFTIPAGASSTKIIVEVAGDTVVEGDEKFRIKLSNVVDAIFKKETDAIATGTIQEDDLTIRFRDGGNVAQPTVISQSEGNTGSTNMVFHVDLNAPAPKDIEVTFKVAGVTAESTTDFTLPTTLKVTIPAGQTTGVFNVPIVGDGKAEATETFTVTIDSAPGAAIDASHKARTGEILNDDATFKLLGNKRVVEGQSGNSEMVFDVELTGVTVAPGTEYTVDYETIAGTASSGADYAATTGTLRFVATGVQQIRVPIIGDTAVEGDENFTVKLINSKFNTQVIEGILTETAIGTIQDDETSISIGNASLTEGNAGQQSMNFVVSLPIASTIPIVVTYSTADGTARGVGADVANKTGRDYISATDRTLTINPGQTSGVISIPILGDLVKEFDETFQVRLTQISGAVASNAVGTGTIISDNDTAPSIAIADAKLVESDTGTAAMKFVVSLSHAAREDVSFKWVTSDGTAGSADYGQQTITTVSIPVGTLSVELSVPITGDISVEGNETFTVTISEPRVGTEPDFLSISDGTATGTIEDDDAILRVKASAATVTVVEDNNGATPTAGKARVALDLGLPDGSSLAGALTVQYSITAPTVAGSTAASATKDYVVPVTTTKTFAAGTLVSDMFIEVDIVADSIDEWDESFVVTLTGATGAKLDSDAVDLISAVTITDSDEAPKLQISGVQVQESLTAGANFLVRLVGNVTERDIAVRWDALSFTAFAGSDFTARENQNVTIAAGARETTLNVPLINDTADEGDETFRVALSSAQFSKSGTTEDVLFVDEDVTNQGTKRTATGTILKNDSRAVTVSGGTVVEGLQGDTTKKIRFTISLDAAPSSTPITVNYTTVDGNDSAKAVDDYVSNSGSVTFAVGEREKTVEVAIVSDDIAELDEIFGFRISLPSNSNAVLGGTVQAVGTIESDESVFRLERVLSSGESQDVTEGGKAKFKVVRSGATNFPSSVTFEAVENLQLAANVRALVTSDFSRLTGSIAFDANQTDSSVKEQFIEISITDDSVAESDNEQFLVRLTGATNGIISETDGSKSVTIIDNDAGPDPLVRITSSSVNEGGTVSFVVKLLTASGEPLTAKYPVRITYSAILGSGANAANSADFTSAFSETTKTLEIPVNASEATISIATLQDSNPEVSETFTVKLTKVEKIFGSTTEILNPFLPETALTPRAGFVEAVGTILNDDSIITVAPVSQFEGTGTATPIVFVASIPQVATFPVTFHYKTKLATGTGAASIADFVEVEGDVTIPAGQTQVSFQVGITPDTAREGNEIFNVELTSPVNGILANANSEGKAVVVGTILNDDAGPQITISSTSIDEAGPGGTSVLTFTVSLTGDTTENVTVNFATSDGTAKSSGAIIDYVSKNGTITFGPHTGSSPATQIVQILVNGDDWKEGDETMLVTLSEATGGAEIATPTATGTITDGTDSKIGVFLTGAAVVEGGSASFKLGFTSLPSEAITFTVNTRNGSADSTDYTAISNRVYTLNGNTLSFVNSNGENTTTTVDSATSTAAISVSTRNDGNFEASENFHLDVSGGTGNAGVPSAGRTASAIIYNDDVRILSAREFEFIDEDGDLVNVKFSKGTLFTVSSFGQFQDRGLISLETAGNVGGRSLSTINLLGTGREFEGANISVTRKAQAGFDLPTDGKVNVGALFAANPGVASLGQGVNLGTVKVDGDLGRIYAGSTLRPLSVAKIDVASFGIQPDNIDDASSLLFGRVGSITVHGDFGGKLQILGTTVNFATGVTTGLGNVGSIMIKGKVVGGSSAQSGYIESNASISKLTVGGVEGGSGSDSGRIFATRSIGKFTALGDIEGGSGIGSGQVLSQLLGDITFGKAAKRGFVGISAGIVGGEAGGDAGTDGDTVTRQVGSGAVISYSSIKSVTMYGDGSVKGGEGKNSGMIFAQGNIAKMVLGSIVGGEGAESGRVRALGSIGSLSADTILGGSASNSGSVEATGRISNVSVVNILGPTGQISGTADVVRSGSIVAGDLGNVLVKGIVGRGTATGATLIASGAIMSFDSIDSLTVKGAVNGIDQAQNVTISARNHIGRIDIGTMKFAEILAGYEASTTQRGTLRNADAQIGPVTIGEYAGGSIVAGIAAGTDGHFGTSADSVPASGVTNSSQIISRIASITVKTLTAAGVTEPAGFVAQKIGIVKVAGVRIPFTSDGPFAINGTQVFINEV
jgi:hypothetical protein